MWIVLSSSVGVFLTISTLYFVSGVNASHGAIHTMIVLGKIGVSMASRADLEHAWSDLACSVF
jgi:hypothetical protein